MPDLSHPPETDLQPDPALHLLLSASATLRDRRGVAEVLSGILDLSRQLIDADAYAVWRTYDQGKTWTAVATSGLSASYRTHITGSPAWHPSREPVVIPDVNLDPLVQEQRTNYLQEGVRSLIVLPLWIDDQPVGSITLYFRTPRTFSDRNLSYATGLASFAAVALQTSELQESNRLEKLRLSFLSEASAVLASSLDYELTLERVAHLVVPRIANWCTVHILEGDSLSRIAVAHADPGLIKMAKEFAGIYPERLEPDRGIGRVLCTGESNLLTEIPDGLMVAAAYDATHLQMLRGLKMTSLIEVPLKSRGRIFGALRLIATGRKFDHDDLRLAESLATRAAVAVDNARLYRELLENERQLRLSHAAAKMGSWSWDLINQKIHWSEEFKALHRVPSATVASYDRGQDLVHPDDRERILKELDAVLASNAQELSFEHRCIAEDGSVLWIHSRGKITRDAAGKAVSMHGIAMDVTDRRNTEDALRRTEKLAAAGRMAATVAHETNNPLEAVTNLVYLARNTPDLPPEALQHLAIAEEELKRIAQIVRQTLGFYRESAIATNVQIGGLIDEVLDIYRRRLDEKKISLTKEIENGLQANIVAGEIVQVLANIVGNALDATSRRGSIHVSAKSSKPFIEIAITDSGPGVTKQAANRLFEPFFTTKKDIGTGLGLWVSKGIIEKHHGSITFANNEKGTTFTIRLPQQPPL